MSTDILYERLVKKVVLRKPTERLFETHLKTSQPVLLNGEEARSPSIPTGQLHHASPARTVTTNACTITQYHTRRKP